MARIKAVLRRITPVCDKPRNYTNGELTVDLDEYVTEINGNHSLTKNRNYLDLGDQSGKVFP